MNKKLIALALVLLLAVGGLFALATVTDTLPVEAKLYANIGDYLYHGFTKDSQKFLSSIEFYDAFNIDPVFDYGYQTNAQGQYDFLMSVGDFIHTDGVTKIRIYDVTKDGVSMTPVLDESDYVYELFDTVVNTVSKGSGYVADEAAFKIIPAKKIHDGTLDHLGLTTIGDNTEYVDYADAEDSAPGSYTSTITIRIKAV